MTPMMKSHLETGRVKFNAAAAAAGLMAVNPTSIQPPLRIVMPLTSFAKLWVFALKCLVIGLSK